MMEEADVAEAAARGRAVPARGAHRQALLAGRRRGAARARVRERSGRQAGGGALRADPRGGGPRSRRSWRRSAACSTPSTGPARADVAFRYGVRWATRHQNPELGAQLFEEALEHDPGNEGAFAYLRDLWGTKQGDWDRVVKLAEKTGGPAAASPFMLAQAGLVLWRNVGNLMRARSWFEKLAAIAPGSPEPARLRGADRREAGRRRRRRADRTGEADIQVESAVRSISRASATTRPRPCLPSPSPPRLPCPRRRTLRLRCLRPRPLRRRSRPRLLRRRSRPRLLRRRSRPSRRRLRPRPVAAAPAPAAPAAASSRAGEARRSTSTSSLAKAQKQEQAKRYNEYVKTLIELAEAVDEPAREDRLLHQGRRPLHDQVLERGRGGQVLRGHPRARRRERPGHRLPPPELREAPRLGEAHRPHAPRGLRASPRAHARAPKFLEIAKLATERVKKPETCIELWNEVIASDPENSEALNALAGLHERAKDWPALAVVLQKQVDTTFDAKAKEALLGKLGALYGERLNDDAAAVEAWRQLLALNPQDRKAQEALKKKYLTLGRWDDLEVFYAESGKWDEFIRVLESQEAKETDDKVKISLLMKIAELWMAQKGKPDRAARAYEKVLSIDGKHLAAAEALIPLYEQAGNPKGLSTVIEVKLRARPGRRHQARALPPGRGPLRDQAQGAAARLRALPLGLRARARRRAVRRGRRARRARHRGWDALIASYGAAIARADEALDHDLAIALRLRLGRVLRDEVKRVDDALAQFRAVYDADGENADGHRRARAALPRHRPLRRPARHLREEARSDARPGRAPAHPLRHRRPLRERAQGSAERRSPPTSRCSTTRRWTRRRSPPSTSSTAAESEWEPYVEVLAQAHRHRRRGGAPHRSQVPPRRRRSRSTSAIPSGALDNYREILLSTRATTRRAPRSRPCCENPDLRAEAAAILEEIYESRSDWEKLIQALEILAAAAPDVAGRVRLLRKVAHTAAENLGDIARAFDAEARALKDDPANLETRAELEALAERANAWEQASTSSSARSREGISDAAARARLLDAPRRHRRAARQGRRGRGRTTCASSPSTRPTRRRSPRWTRSTGAPSAGAISSASTAAASSSPPTAPDREKLYAQMAEVYETRLHKPEDAIAAYREVLGLDETLQRRAHRARRPLHAAVDVGGARREPRGPAPPRLRRGRADPAHAPPRRAARVEDEHDRAGDRGLQPGPRARAVRTPTRSPRWSGSARCPSTSCTSPRSSSRSTARRATTASSSACTRCRCAAATTRPVASSCSTKSPLSTRTPAAISPRRSTPTRAPSRRTRPRCRRRRASIASPAPRGASPTSRGSSRPSPASRPTPSWRASSSP